MKYILDSKNNIVAMRMKFVKFLFAMLAALTVVPSYAIEYTLPKKFDKDLVYKGSSKSQPMFEAGTAEEGYAFQYQSSSIKGTLMSVPEATNVGTYTYTYSLRSTSAVLPDPDPEIKGEIEVTIAPYPVTVKYETKFTYDGTEQGPEAAIVQDGFFSGDNVKIVTEGHKILPGDDYVATAHFESSKEGDKSYMNYVFRINSKTTLEIPFSIAKKSIGHPTSPSSLAKTTIKYDGKDHTPLTLGENTDGQWEYCVLLSTETFDYTDKDNNNWVSDPTVKNAGKYRIEYRFVPEESDKYATYYPEGPYSFEVTQKEVDVKWGTLSLPCTGSAQVPEASVAAADKEGTDVVNVTVTDEDGELIYPGVSHTAVASLSNSNYSISSTTQSAEFEIVKVKPVAGTDFSIKANSGTYDGTLRDLVIADDKGIGSFSYKLSADGTYSTTLPQETDKGDYTVYYKFSKDGKCYSSVEGKVDVSISAKPVTIEWTSDKLPYTGSAQSPVPSVKASDICAADKGKLSVTLTSAKQIKVGDEYTATAKLTGDAAANYVIKTGASYPFSIYEVDLTFEAPTVRTGLEYKEAAHYLVTAGAAPTSGVVEYATLTEGEYEALTKTDKNAVPADDAFKTNLPEATNAGTYYIYYRLNPDAEGVASTTPVLITAEIAKRKLTAVWDIIDSKVYDGILYKPTATFTGFVEGGTEFDAVVSFRTTPSVSVDSDGKSVGTQYVRADVPEAYKNNYTIDNDEKYKRFNSFVITGKPLTLTVAQAGWTYGGTATTPSVDGNECEATPVYTYYTDEALTKATSTTDGASAAGKCPTYAGTYYVKATVAASGVCDKAEASGKFVIAKKPITVTWTNTVLTYKEGVEQAPTATATGATVTLVVTGKETAVGPAEGETYTATASLSAADSRNYTIASGATTEFVINPVAVTLTVAQAGWTYGGTATTPSVDGNECEATPVYTYYTDEALTKATSTTDGASAAGKCPTYAGTYYVKATVAASGACDKAEASGKFVIAKKPITVTWTNTVLTYKEGVEQAPTATATGATVTLVVTGGQTAVGPAEGETYTATASLSAADSRNYTIASGATTEFVINPVAVTLTVAQAGWTYGGTATTPSVDGNECEATPVYTYYTDETLTKATSTTDGASAAGKCPTYAGTYYVKATVAASGVCDKAEASGKFVIAKKPITVTWTNTVLTYKEGVEQAPTPTATGATVTLVVAGGQTAVGPAEGETYTATASLSAADSRNYTIASGATTEFTIIEEVKNYTAPEIVANLSYIGSAQYLTTEGDLIKGSFKFVTGVMVGGELSEVESDKRQAVKNAGDYIVSVYYIPEEGDPVVLINKETVTIAKAPVSLVWSENTELVYNGTEQAPEVSVNTADLKGNDVVGLVVSGKETNVGPAEGTEYIATVTGLAENVDGANYYIAATAVTSKNFSIVRSNEISFTKPTAKGWTYDGSEYPLLIAGKSTTPGKFYYALKGETLTADVIPVATVPGKYKVGYQFVPTDNGYYPSVVDSIEVEVLQKEIKITEWDSTKFEYNGYAHQPKPTEWTGMIEVEWVLSGAETKIGNNYIATASLTDAAKALYKLSSNETEFSIVSRKVAKPAITVKEFDYDGTLHTFVAESEYYTIVGESGAIEPDKYPVRIDLAAGNVWMDGTTASIKDTFVIKKMRVAKPAADKTSYFYNGKVQTYKFEESDKYTVSGNKQIAVGTHEVTVSLVDKAHYIWSDTEDGIDKIYEFVISTGTVKVPVVDSVLTYSYDGKEKNFGITVYEGSILADSNAVGTTVGKYIRTVALDMDENGGYVWDDLSEEKNKTFVFTIEPQKVNVPVVTETDFIYNGTPFNFEVPADTAKVARYSVDMETTNEVGPGVYKAYAYLNDTINYVWNDPSKGNDTILFTFTIGSGEIEVPEVASSYVYTGEPIVFVPENSAYTVEVESADGANGIDVGRYTVTITPKTNYKWKNGSTEAKVKPTKIVEKPIDKPDEPVTPVTYDGQDHYRVPKSEYYDITGDLVAVEPGLYKDTLTLKSSNYAWDDGTKSPLVFTYEITKIKIAYPEDDKTTFVYDGTEQTYTLDYNPEICEISSNKQTDAGNYNVTLAITSPYHVFENGLTEKKYPFVISKKTITEPSAPQTVFDFDGTEKEFAINESDYYIINPEFKTGVEVGTYDRTVALADKTNYMWADGSTDDITITFTINASAVSLPAIVKEYNYTGSPITFLKSNSAYTVTNGTQTDAGEYDVLISLNPGFVWTGGATNDTTIKVEILPVYVEKPNVVETTFDWDGSVHSFGFEPSDGYSFVGDTAAKEPAVYTVIVKLNKNYIWDDDSKEDVDFTFVISKLEVAMPMANTSKYVYDGMAHNYHVDIPSDSLFTVSDTTQINAGKYSVKVALKDPLHYVWADSTSDDLAFDFIINKAKVALPTAPTVNLKRSETEQELVVNPSKYYQVNDSNATAILPGDYIRTVTLVDTANYTWVDGTVEYKSIVFTIGDGYIAKPDIQLEYTYTGDTIVFVPEDGAYIVVNGAKKEVGKYRVVVVPNEGYLWADSTNQPLVFNVVINPIIVEKPDLQLEYTYTGKIIDFKVPAKEGYVVTGVTSGKELGKYKAELTLISNYMWNDSTAESVSYVFSINKKVVPVPPVVDSVFVYNGRRQTYTIAKTPDYNVVGNIQSSADSYDVIVILSDQDHSIWSDSTTTTKTYIFEIHKCKVDLPTAVQSSFSFDGTTKYFTVTENKAYEVLPKNASASAVGVYERTVALKDSLNYTWIDGSMTDKTVVFTINNGLIDFPQFIADTVYTGSPIVFVPANNAYDVVNGTQVAAGKYVVTVTLKDGYLWSDLTNVPVTDTVVIKERVIEKPIFPTTNTYTYDLIPHGVVIPEAVGYKVYGVTETKEPGTYNVIVALDPNYMWSDGTLDTLNYTFVINRISVEIPAQVDSVFRFTGSEITYPIADTLPTYTVSGHHRASAGMHFVTAALNDTAHYMWTDLTVAPKVYEFLIDKYKVELPVALNDSFTYDGMHKFFDIVENEHYDVEKFNASAVDTGVYLRKVTLSDTINFLWADGTVEPKYVAFYILKGVISSINIPTNLTYTGDTILLIEEKNYYSVTYNKVINAGTYKVVVTPNLGYSWAYDGSRTGIEYIVVVHPKKVAIPAASEKVYKYNAAPQVYDLAIPSDSVFTVVGNVQSEVGTYEVVATLKDDKNYIWSDSTVTPKSYLFTISNSEFFVDPILSSGDLSTEVIPGHYASFNVNVLGNVYKYWAVCDSCPALKIDTTDVIGGVNGIDIFIPDTVKPGVYNVEVVFMSGTLKKSQIVEVRVNYPSTYIYLIWDDVLTINNTEGVFKKYQWYKNGVAIEGATKQYYQENESLDGYYSCLVNDSLFVGPLFFHVDKPLWIKAYGSTGTIDVEVVGDIPVGTKVSIYNMAGIEIDSKDALQSFRFDELSRDIYFVKLIGPDLITPISSQSVKVVVK